MRRVCNAAVRSGLPVFAAAIAFIGCTSNERSGGNALWAYEDRPTPNLVLGSPEHNLLAQEFVGRLQWPSTDAGYQVEDESFFSTFSYDDQSFYDVYSGGYSRQSVSGRTGVIVR